MNTLKITVSCDRKAALLNGLVLGETCEVEVSPETIGAEWPRLVSLLDMSLTPPVLDRNGGYPGGWGVSLEVSDPTPEAVKNALEKVALFEQGRKDNEAAKLTRAEEEYEASASACEARLTEPMTPERRDSSTVDEEKRDLGYFDGLKRDLPYHSYYGNETLRIAAARARRDAAHEANKAVLEAANKAAFEAQLPALLKAKADRDAAEAAAKEEKKAADKAKFAKRLENGMWTRDTSSYNEKRYGAWWVASIDFSSGSKGDYTFGDSSGKWGSAGELSIACTPGDFIAYGQKDLRRPDKSEHTVLRMREDGSMETFDSKAEAYKAFKAAKVAA